ncbi:MAG: tRNA adenosine(34) deaminase TadA [Coriobacteriales bacterium]|jgi:tRNA(adenine34) deaminase|nr:tRNA adenosine(34) deaminase TadA [Coriobacteriales bacterium]
MDEIRTEFTYDGTHDGAFMRLAIEQAHIAASMGEVPIGAVVVSNDEVIASGYNRREIDVNPSAHAEFTALVAASRRLGRWRLTGCTVYVTLEPCLMCAGLMQLARIDRCVYGAADPKGGALGTLYKVHCDERLNHSFEVIAGVCEQECSALLSGFFASLRATQKATQKMAAPAPVRPRQEAPPRDWANV